MTAIKSRTNEDNAADHADMQAYSFITAVIYRRRRFHVGLDPTARRQPARRPLPVFDDAARSISGFRQL